MRKILTAAVAVAGIAGFGGTAGAGVQDGPVTETHKCEARATDTHRFVFRAGEPAAVLINGDRDTDLDLEVFDATGRLVASDYGLTDVAVCTWTPAQTGVYTIRVKNLGGVWNRYTLRTN
jgi:hypothetical protein